MWLGSVPQKGYLSCSGLYRATSDRTMLINERGEQVLPGWKKLVSKG